MVNIVAFKLKYSPKYKNVSSLIPTPPIEIGIVLNIEEIKNIINDKTISFFIPNEKRINKKEIA